MTLSFDQSFIHDLLNCACPKCMHKGVVYFNPMTAHFSCSNCKALSIDPYAIGPWDEGQHTIDTFSGNVVSSFLVDGEQSPPTDPDTNYLDFLKYMYEKGEVTP